MSNELATLDVNQWEIMKQQGKMLVETGFLPEAISDHAGSTRRHPCGEKRDRHQ